MSLFDKISRRSSNSSLGVEIDDLTKKDCNSGFKITHRVSLKNGRSSKIQKTWGLPLPDDLKKIVPSIQPPIIQKVIKPMKCPPPVVVIQLESPVKEPRNQPPKVQLEYDKTGIPLPPPNTLDLPPIPRFSEMQRQN